MVAGHIVARSRAVTNGGSEFFERPVIRPMLVCGLGNHTVAKANGSRNWVG